MLMNELAALKDQLGKGKASQATSGMEPSPWSAVGVESMDSSSGGGIESIQQHGRHGRHFLFDHF